MIVEEKDMFLTAKWKLLENFAQVGVHTTRIPPKLKLSLSDVALFANLSEARKVWKKTKTSPVYDPLSLRGYRKPGGTNSAAQALIFSEDDFFFSLPINLS